MKNILITGGAGFIGANLSIELVKRGYNVTVLDNLSEQIHGANPEAESETFKMLGSSINFIKGSVTDSEILLRCVLDSDAVVHLAAETGTGQSMYNILNYEKVNIGGTAVLLELLSNNKHNVQKLVVASSRAIYGEGKYKCEQHGIVYPSERNESDLLKGDFECKCPYCNSEVKLMATSEDSALSPRSVYGVTKLTQEQLVHIVAENLGIGSVALRYQNVYGPGQSLRNPYTGILSIFSTQIKNSNSINVFEDGEESRDFVYITDVVNATILSLENKAANGQSYNVGTGVNSSIIDIINLLKENYNEKVDYNISGDFRLGDIRHNYAEINKIKIELGFMPAVGIKEGISNFCKWVNNQEIKTDSYMKSYNELKEKGLIIKK